MRRRTFLHVVLVGCGLAACQIQPGSAPGTSAQTLAGASSGAQHEPIIYVHMLWHKLADNAPASRMFAYQVMREILHTLARRTDACFSPRHPRERLPAHTVRRLRDYVECSLTEDLDVMAMADIAALSPAHFARAFAATVGMTPFHYVIIRRLARAYELLERTDRSVLDIALGVGFKTQSHFTARFRREFGVTPREIRPDVRRPDERLDPITGI
jgi:AraC family transcriptional regulator